jgi:integrase
MIDFTPTPWPEFRRQLEVLCAPPLRAPATWGKTRQVLGILEGLGIEHTGQLDVEMVARFRSALPPTLSPYTVKAQLSSLRMVCGIAQEKGCIPVNPFALRRMAKYVKVPPLKGKRCLSPSEVARYLDSLRREVGESAGWGEYRARRLLMLAQLLATGGLRLSEATHLWTTDISHRAGTIAIQPHGKALKNANSQATICLPRALSRALLDWERWRLRRPPSMAIPPGCPWVLPNLHATGPWHRCAFGYRPTDQLKAAGERCGLAGVTAQSLRRSFITAAVASGIPLEVAAAQARHDPEVARKYYLDPDVSNLKAHLDGFGYAP